MSIVDARYAHIREIISTSCSRPNAAALDATGMIDTVLTNKYLGIPLFLSLMWSAFMLTFTLATPFMEAIDLAFGYLIGNVGSYVENEQLASLLGDGILGGLGSVLIFVPNIFILFFLLSLMEDSGYLARATFVMDRLMSKIGLHGKSFVPMLMGFGCSVPAIMACRTIENRSDRMVTILSAPFITCGARLPVYVLFAGAYFGRSEGTVVFALYVLSIVVAVLSAKLFRSTMFKGAPSSFIMELPEYRVPTIRTSLLHMWSRGSLYLRKAGTVIFAGVVLIWALASYPTGVEYGAADSIIGSIGKVLESLVAPLGFDWKIAVALIFGFVAKEIVVGALGVLYGAGEDESLLSERLTADSSIGAVEAMGLMVFTLIYMPCIAAVSVIRKETGSWKWTGFSILYSTALAWGAAFLVRHAGLAMGY
jgi:ferrous iron transport protein B